MPNYLNINLLRRSCVHMPHLTRISMTSGPPCLVKARQLDYVRCRYSVQHVRINHRCLNIVVAQQLLCGSNNVAVHH